MSLFSSHLSILAESTIQNNAFAEECEESIVNQNELHYIKLHLCCTNCGF